MPESRLVLFLLALFCPSYALHAGEQQVTDFEKQHRNATSPDFSIAATGDTQGLGQSIGYRFNPYIGMRLRGATLGYSSTETGGNQRTRLNMDGDNAGILVDIYPFDGNFCSARMQNCSSTTPGAGSLVPLKQSKPITRRARALVPGRYCTSPIRRRKPSWCCGRWLISSCWIWLRRD